MTMAPNPTAPWAVATLGADFKVEAEAVKGDSINNTCECEKYII